MKGAMHCTCSNNGATLGLGISRCSLGIESHSIHTRKFYVIVQSEDLTHNPLILSCNCLYTGAWRRNVECTFSCNAASIYEIRLHQRPVALVIDICINTVTFTVFDGQNWSTKTIFPFEWFPSFFPSKYSSSFLKENWYRVFGFWWTMVIVHCCDMIIITTDITLNVRCTIFEQLVLWCTTSERYILFM